MHKIYSVFIFSSSSSDEETGGDTDTSCTDDKLTLDAEETGGDSDRSCGVMSDASNTIHD